MTVVTLVAIWLVEGALVGLLALGARLRPPAWGRRGRLATVGVGAGAALVGGLLGTLVLGRMYSPMVALWIAVVAVAAAPWATAWWQRRRGRADAPTTR
jgi:hypothetical protein